jgi:hypothetical protein
MWHCWNYADRATAQAVCGTAEIMQTVLVLRLYVALLKLCRPCHCSGCGWHCWNNADLANAQASNCWPITEGQEFISRKLPLESVFGNWHRDRFFPSASDFPVIIIPQILHTHIRRNQQYVLIVPLLYSTCWLLHVSVVACHHQGAYWILLSYVKYKRRGGISKIYNR